MKRLYGLTAVAAACLTVAVLWCSPAFATPEEYSAVMETYANGRTSRSMMYVNTDMQRIEMLDSAEGAVTIVRGDLDVVWMLMPDEEMYMEMDMSDQYSNPLTTTGSTEVSRVKVGEENVDGHPCNKEQVTVTYDSGDTDTMYQWSATDLDGMPIKAEALDGSWKYTLHDIRTGHQDENLFEVPPGYEEMNIGGYGGMHPDYPSAPDYPSPPSVPSPPGPW